MGFECLGAVDAAEIAKSVGKVLSSAGRAASGRPPAGSEEAARAEAQRAESLREAARAAEESKSRRALYWIAGGVAGLLAVAGVGVAIWRRR